MPTAHALSIDIRVDASELEAAERKLEDFRSGLDRFTSTAEGMFSGLARAAAGFSDSAERAATSVAALDERIGTIGRSSMPGAIDTVRSGFDEMGGLARDFTSSVGRTFDDTLVALMEGRFDDIGELWRGLLGSMVRDFLDMIRNVGSQTIPINIGIFGQGLAPGGGGALGGLGGIFGGGDLSSISLGGLNVPLTGIGSAIAGVLGLVEGGATGTGVGIGGLAGAGLSLIPGVGPILGAVAPIIGGIIGSLFGSSKRDFEILLNGSIADVQTGVPGGREGGGDFSLITTRAEEFKGPFLEVLRATLGSIEDTLALFSPDAVSEFLAAGLSLEGGGRFVSGDKARKNLQAFITGGFIRPLFGEIEGAFVSAFTDIGISAEAAGGFTTALGSELDRIFEETKDWDDREKRGELMLEALDAFLVQMSSLDAALTSLPERFGDLAAEIAGSGGSFAEVAESIAALQQAAALLEPGVLDPVAAAIRQIEDLASGLGFEGIPTMEQFRESVERMIASAEIEPETVSRYVALRDAIEAAQAGLTSSIASLSALVQGTEGSLGIPSGVPADALRSAVGSVRERLSQGGITSEGRQVLLQELAALTTRLAEATSGATGAIVSTAELRIGFLEEERDLIEEGFSARIRGLREELRTAELFGKLARGVRSDLDDLVFGASSPLTAIERFNRLQAEVGSAASSLSSAVTDEERLDASARLRELQGTLFSLGGDAFSTGSAEIEGLFAQVTGVLAGLGTELDARAGTADAITAEIAAVEALQLTELGLIDAELGRLRTEAELQLSATEGMSAEVSELFEFIRTEATTLLDERLSQLASLTGDGASASLGELEKQTGLLQDILDDSSFIVLRTGDLPPFDTGAFASGGVVSRPTLALLGEGGEREFVIPESMLHTFRGGAGGLEGPQRLTGDIQLNFGDIVVNGVGGDPKRISKEILQEISLELRRGELGRQLRSAGAGCDLGWRHAR